MASDYALNEIRHGEEDGTVVVYEPGDRVDLNEDELEALRANGSVGDKPADPEKLVKEKEELEAEIAELREQLNEALAASTPPNTPGPPTMTQQ